MASKIKWKYDQEWDTADGFVNEKLMFYIAPGIYTKEKDKSYIVSNFFGGHLQVLLMKAPSIESGKLICEAALSEVRKTFK